MIQKILDWFLDWYRGYGLLGRASDWGSWRKAHIKLNCGGCGKKGTLLNPLELHHVIPYNVDPTKEKDPNNVETVCRRCHQLICHLDNFKSWNVEAREDLAILLEKIHNRP